ncbi:hypothetical protein GGTG_06770 [Gaeumannomyces tritici R3-111a-1]|uniref:Uncharacterized protein n=1 Tax=Gaeumannomyces tritici (strain R3-111a-1) TaxID=644352 RepID=J3NZS3_GAET3|nr:hypothetical protein GGTG_06770 [Gaeumannomyces tritici R3-111a-1]EJT76856.1 hypothetical protein GGTG_06770 [Gaeumannomyces tritici R3-111a-1]
MEPPAPPQQQQQQQQHAVYLVKSRVGLPDPDMPGPRYHHVIFVETNVQDRSGVKFHVVGDITSSGGMTYESRAAAAPERARWDALLRGLPTPPRQKAFNAATGRAELVKAWVPGVVFYEPGEARHVPWKCTEWTNEHALPALWAAGFIVGGEVLAGSAAASSPV